MYSQTFKILLIASFFLFLAFSTQGAEEKIDINTAHLEDLVKIIHIGEVRALELISLRPFSSLDDLVRIKGIAEKRVEDIKNQGLAWVGIQEEPKPEPEPTPASESEPQTEPPPESKPETSKVEPRSSEPTMEPDTVSTSTEELFGTEPRTIYPAGVVINEILPSPQGPDAEEEWIEIYNTNNFEVNLSGWQIKDSVGKTNLYAFTKGTVVSPQGFLVLSRPTTGITLNNSGDGLNLLQPDGGVVYTVSYEKAPRGESFNRTEDEWLWSKTLTPGSANITPTPEEIPQPKTDKIETEPTEVGRRSTMAAVGGQLPKSSDSRLIVSIALALAIFSGAMVLTLKKKLKMS